MTSITSIELIPFWFENMKALFHKAVMCGHFYKKAGINLHPLPALEHAHKKYFPPVFNNLTR